MKTFNNAELNNYNAKIVAALYAPTKNEIDQPENAGSGSEEQDEPVVVIIPKKLNLKKAAKNVLTAIDEIVFTLKGQMFDGYRDEGIIDEDLPITLSVMPLPRLRQMAAKLAAIRTLADTLWN